LILTSCNEDEMQKLFSPISLTDMFRSRHLAHSIKAVYENIKNHKENTR